MMEQRIPETYLPEMPYPSQDIHMMPDPPFMHGMYRIPGMCPAPGGPCIPQETVLRNIRLAAAYVPFQKFCGTYPPIEGLDKGTIFPELYSPYRGEHKKSRPPEYE